MDCIVRQRINFFIVFDCSRQLRIGEKVYVLSNDTIYRQIDNDLSISRNVSSNKMIHAILALVFLAKLFLSSRFSAL